MFCYFCFMQNGEQTLPEKFLDFLLQTCGCSGKEFFILAVSGGIDSMVMMELFRRNGLRFAVAHCNFRLRGKESDGDEAFVKQKALDEHVEFYSRSFDTTAFSLEKGISIQMAARDLRYDWFDELARDTHCDFIATAHNRDDSVETFLINLSRGTGITGLTGIRAATGRIIRPMLFLTRKEIQSFAESMNIPWREDSSNRTVKYLRNRIRHLILPRIEKILPGFSEGLVRTMTRLKDSKDLLDTVADQFIQDAVTISGHRVEVDRNKILKFPAAKLILYTVLQKYGFNYDTVENLVETFGNQPGRRFLSGTHELTVDRSMLIIQPVKAAEDKETEVGEEVAAVQYPVHLSFRSVMDVRSYEIPGDKTIASLDRDVVAYPLKIRKWKEGDYFYPFGMEGRKKLSDFFAGEKIPLPDKQRVWILESGGNIVWVIGMRIDHRYRITTATRSILQITYHPGYEE
jgi:tRNA(Ile)-lysidine synthase